MGDFPVFWFWNLESVSLGGDKATVRRNLFNLPPSVRGAGQSMPDCKQLSNMIGTYPSRVSVVPPQ